MSAFFFNCKCYQHFQVRPSCPRLYVKLKLLPYKIPLRSLPFAAIKLTTGHTVNVDDLPQNKVCEGNLVFPFLPQTCQLSCCLIIHVLQGNIFMVLLGGS